MTKRHRLSLMTVFLPRENIFFIEEWLNYHLAIGFDHFYLYDNMGSRWLDCGNNLEVNARNKRGEKVYQLLADRDDAQVRSDLESLLEPFERRGYVTHVIWQPRDRDGQITYGQSDACLDYVERFGRDTDWVALTDLDEFIVPMRDDDLTTTAEGLDRERVTRVMLPQKCFASRFDGEGNPVNEVLRITQCASLVTADFGRKALIRARTLRIPWARGRFSIHSPSVARWRTKSITDASLVRFNHYKFNQWELDWLATNLGLVLTLDQTDDGMLRFLDRVQAR